MKVVERIKKGLIVLGTFLLTIPTKVLAVSSNIIDAIITESMNAEPVASLYGPPRVSRYVVFTWRIAKTFIVPIALLIGLLIYFKKSKSSKKKKTLVAIIITSITAILCFVINKIIQELV